MAEDGGFRCAADRQVAKGLWIAGTLATQGLAGLRWEATGVEDPSVRAKVEESVRSSTAAGDVAGAFFLEVALDDIVGPPQRSKPPTKPLMRLQVQGSAGKPKSSVVFRFLSDDSRDTIIDVVQPLLAKRRKTVSSGPSSDPFASVSGADVKAKRKLLLKNAELGELYKQVVNSGTFQRRRFATPSV